MAISSALVTASCSWSLFPQCTNHIVLLPHLRSLTAAPPALSLDQNTALSQQKYGSAEAPPLKVVGSSSTSGHPPFAPTKSSGLGKSFHTVYSVFLFDEICICF
jgi:hypothetical protein